MPNNLRNRRHRLLPAGAVVGILTTVIFCSTAVASAGGVHVVDAKERFSFYAPPGFRVTPSVKDDWVYLIDTETRASMWVRNPYGVISLGAIRSWLANNAFSRPSYRVHVGRSTHTRYSFGVTNGVFYTVSNAKYGTFYGEDVRFLYRYRAYEFAVQAFSPSIVRTDVAFALQSWGT